MPAKGIPGIREDLLISISKIIPINEKSAYQYARPPQKHKRKLFNAICVLAIIFITAFIVFFLLYYGKTPEQQNENLFFGAEERSPNPPATCEDDCQLQNALANRTAALCDNIANEGKKQDCYLVISGYSVETCMSLNNYSQKKSCVEFHAVRLENSELCNNLEVADREACVNKTDLCHSTRPEEKPLCKALAQNNYRYCEKEYGCILNYAQATEDAGACSELTTRLRHNICISIALKKDECISLPAKDEIDACQETYALRTNQSSVCGSISRNTDYAANCYTYFSGQSKNLNLCNGLFSSKRWDCYRSYAKETGDVQGCIRISVSSNITRQFCFVDIAYKYGNPQVCGYLEDPAIRDLCFREAIQDNGLLTHEKCTNITSTEWDMRCYTNAAKLEQNISVCDLQGNEADVRFCRDNYK